MRMQPSSIVLVLTNGWLSVVFVLGCASADDSVDASRTKPSIPVAATIVVDEDHNIGARDDVRSYEVPPCDVLRLDVSRYDFGSSSESFDSVPDTIHMVEIVGQGRIYAGKWIDGDVQELSRESVKWVGGDAGTFGLFEAGTSYVVGIGKSGVADNDAVTLRVVWAAKVKVGVDP